jgi:hypothetical protein
MRVMQMLSQVRRKLGVCAAGIAMISGCDGYPDDSLSPGQYTVTAVGGAPFQNDATGEALCENFTSRLTVKNHANQPAYTFDPNEVVRFELAVTNQSGVQQSLPSGATCFPTSFSVADYAGTEVWNNLNGIFCVARYMPQQFAPLETVTFAATWDQSKHSNLNPPGSLPSPLPKCRAALSASTVIQIVCRRKDFQA